jgi:hypothetical protein
MTEEQRQQIEDNEKAAMEAEEAKR